MLFNSSEICQVEGTGSIRVFGDCLPEEVAGLRGWQWGLGYVLFCNLISEFFLLFIMSVCSYSLGFKVKLTGYRSNSYSCLLSGVLIRPLRLGFRDIPTCLIYYYRFRVASHFPDVLYFGSEAFKNGLTKSIQNKKIKSIKS